MKKDLKPIWIYLLTAIVGSFALGIIAGIIDYFTLIFK